MILQRLVECYDLLKEDVDILVPDIGYSIATVSTIIELTTEGIINSIIPIEKENMIVPFEEIRTRNVFPYFLCDNTKYLLGIEWDENKKVKLTSKHLSASINLHKEIMNEIEDVGKQALLYFFDKLKNNDDIGYDIEVFFNVNAIGNIVFKLAGENGYIHERKALKVAWQNYLGKKIKDNSIIGQCILTGENNQLIQKIHSNVKIKDGQTSGASIVSFNKDSFASYGKKKGLNSPIAFEEMFKYTTSLQILIRNCNNHCYLKGATCVFWTNAGVDSFETNFFRNIINKDYEETTIEDDTLDNGDSLELDEVENQSIQSDVADKSKEIKDTISKISRGDSVKEVLEAYKDTKVYMIGLSPNMSRIAVKFFYESSFGDFVNNIEAHYQRLDITTALTLRSPISTTDLIRAGTRTGAMKDCPDFIKDKLLYSILNNKDYPHALYTKHLQRYILDNRTILKEEAKGSNKLPKETWELIYRNHTRIAFIKAYLKQKQEKTGEIIGKEEEITVSLNTDNQSIGYNLGRLFAVLEIIQEKAGNKTLAERFFAGSCTTPRAMFTSLMKNSQNHLAKIKKDESNKALGYFYEKLVSEILAHIENGFPTSLNQKEQGFFMIGYYHQKQAVYRKKEKIENNEGGSDNEGK